MTRLRQIKTNFTSGAISRRLLGRGDLRAYENGALTLQNVFIHPTGGVSRRPGLAYVADAPGAGRLISFEFNTEQTYLIVLTDLAIDIYIGSQHEASLSAPWTEAQIREIVWTQSADTLFLTHPEVAPRILTRTGGGSWSLVDWPFLAEGDLSRRPFYKFAAAGVTLDPGATSGTGVTVTASADVFDVQHENTWMRIKGRQVLVTDVSSPTVAVVDILETLPDADATTDWEEQAFSALRGYPVSVTFHQDRLVIGGSRDLPNRMWFSQSGDIWNFDRGTGLDDEAIEFAILSDQVNAIRSLFSGRDLQVFTSGAEWAVSGEPLAPSSIELRRQTRIGTVLGRSILPVNVDGATLFVARNRREIREFLFTSAVQAYESADLALLAENLVFDVVEQDFDPSKRQLFVVRADGKVAALTLFRNEKVTAWTLYETDGMIESVAVVGDETFFLILRNGARRIEQLDDTLNLDSALTGADPSGAAKWSGLDHLIGKDVRIVADGVVKPLQTVQGDGSITLDTPAEKVEIGLPYRHIVEPLPPNALAQNGAGRATRLIEGIFRLENTAALRVDTGGGLKNAIFKELDGGDQFDIPSDPVYGDVRLSALGWRHDTSKPLWRIEQDLPVAFTLLSVTAELKVND